MYAVRKEQRNTFENTDNTKVYLEEYPILSDDKLTNNRSLVCSQSMILDKKRKRNEQYETCQLYTSSSTFSPFSKISMPQSANFLSLQENQHCQGSIFCSISLISNFLPKNSVPLKDTAALLSAGDGKERNP